LAEPKFNQMA